MPHFSAQQTLLTCLMRVERCLAKGACGANQAHTHCSTHPVAWVRAFQQGMPCVRFPWLEVCLHWVLAGLYQSPIQGHASPESSCK